MYNFDLRLLLKVCYKKKLLEDLFHLYNRVCDSEVDCGPGDTSDEGPQCVYPTCQPFEYSCDNKR